jgi:hypothetical protein
MHQILLPYLCGIARLCAFFLRGLSGPRRGVFFEEISDRQPQKTVGIRVDDKFDRILKAVKHVHVSWHRVPNEANEAPNRMRPRNPELLDWHPLPAFNSGAL